MKRLSLVVLAAGTLAATAQRTCFAVVSFTGGAYLQNFDSLPNSGTNPHDWANDSTLPGWSLFAQPTPGVAITSIRHTTGSETNGSFDSFGAAAATDRALGGLGSGTAYFGTPASEAVAGWIAVALANNTAATINSVTISFDGEQWRNNGGTGLAQTMVLEYGLGAGFADVAAWTAPGGDFNWTSPVVSTTGAAVNGNVAGLVADRGGTLASLGWDVGTNLWIRWVEKNDVSNDHALAIDNFELSTGGGDPSVDADFDGDFDVDGDDFLIWQRGLGTGTTNSHGNTNPGDDSDVDAGDLATWRAGYGQPLPTIAAIPEPSVIGLALAGLAAIGGGVRRRTAAI